VRENETVKCANPDDMRLIVTVELTVAQWAQVLNRTSSVPYYAPLDNLKGAISDAITAIKNREAVTYEVQA
jgi:hypothetical protein